MLLSKRYLYQIVSSFLILNLSQFLKENVFFTVESDVEEEEILQSSQESTENDLPEESLIFHEKVDDLDVEVLSILYFDFFFSFIIKITNLI